MRGEWEFDRRPVDIVAIGSQVVYGSVGNSAAIHQFEAAGLRRVSLPAVILTNLPNYPTVHFLEPSDAWLQGALDDLVARGVLETVRFITVGFLAGPGQAKIIGAWLAAIKAQFPQIQVVLDPTLGDDDVGIYTAPGLAQAHLEHLVPVADGLVPNRFELKLLAEQAGLETESLDVVAAARELLSRGPSWVVVTSAAINDPGSIAETIVTAVTTEQHIHPRVESDAKGAGDHFAAALVIALSQGAPLARATEVAAAAVATQM